MKRKLYITTVLVFVSAILSTVCFNNTKSAFWESLAITFATITYHFAMRLMVGGCFHVFMNNKADYQKKWFCVSEKEQEFYKKLQVKKWKNHMPTYNDDTFNPAIHSFDEIAQATCQAELVHETIIVLSFLPILAGIRLGGITVFVITSIAAALFDSLFVIMQRYNRPRILRLVKRQSRIK